VYPDLVDAAEVSLERRGARVAPQPDVTRIYQPMVEKYIQWQGTQSRDYDMLSK
jgi:hypothetical protein